MSSKHKKSAHRRHIPYPSRWSEWTWNEQYRRDARYRETSEGKWEWEYAQPPETERGTPYTPRDQPIERGVHETDPELAADLSAHYQQDEGLSDIAEGLSRAAIDSKYSQHQPYTEVQEYEGSQYQEYGEFNKTDFGQSQATETKCPECSMTFPRRTDFERHHKTVHLNNGVRTYECLVQGCPGNVRSWTTMRALRLHEKNWHGPHSCSVSGCSRRHPFGFSSESDLEIHQIEHSGGLNLGRHRDDLRRHDKKKGSSGNWADTIDGNYHSAAENYPEGGTQPLFQTSSQQEDNVLQEPSFGNESPLLGAPASATTNSELPLYSEDMGYQSQPSSVYTEPPAVITKRNTVSDALDKGYQVQSSKEFLFGRVFKVLWSEPIGDGSTTGITITGPYGERAFHKVRRFLIVSEKNKGHSICIPILTYGNQGVLKAGVHPEDHAVVYSNREPPHILKGEEGLMSKHPIRIELVHAAQKLDPLSRLNYAKLYTVEHNVKVLFIGKVAKDHERYVKDGYNEAHPPLTNTGPGFHHGSCEDLNRGVEGDEPPYPLRKEPSQGGGGPSTHQDYPTYSSNSAYTLPPTYKNQTYPTSSTYPSNPYPAYTIPPNYTNPTYPTSSTYPSDPSYPAYDDGYTGE